jgi:hypothetical protein
MRAAVRDDCVAAHEPLDWDADDPSLQESRERHTEPPSGGHEIHRIQGGQVDRVTPSDAKVGDLKGQD